MPIDIAYGQPQPSEDSSPATYASELHHRLQDAYERVRVTLGQKLDLQKQIYDKKVHGKPFEKDDLVWLHSPVPPRGCPRKLHRPWTGPYRILNE
jgi:hypothetical protein